MKKPLFLLLCLILCFSAMPQRKTNAEKNGIYNYAVLEDGTAVITHYGGDGGEVVIPDNLDGYTVTVIGEGAFRGCSELTYVILPDGIKTIGKQAFVGCTNLTSITIPEGVTSILDEAFSNCISLGSITLPNGLKTIGTKAFERNNRLRTIMLPESVEKMGANPFYGCECLHGILVSSNHPLLATIDGVLFRKREKQLICYPAGKENNSYNVPQGIRMIGEGSFSNCTNLISITLPDSVTAIGERAFDCCSSLMSITLPNSITDIGANPFAYCDNLKSIKVSPDHPTLATINGVLFYKPEKRLVCYPATKDDSSYAVPQGIRVIGDSAFNACHNLNSVFLPDSVTTIGNKAFFSCINLSSITLPMGLTVIGDSLFALCENLTSITLPDSLQIIEATAFFGCDSLCSITVPEGVASIGEMAFASCENLTSITLPSSLTAIGDCAFEYYDSKTVFTVTRGSYAEQYCKDNRLEFSYLDSLDTEDEFSFNGTISIEGADLQLIGNTAIQNIPVPLTLNYAQDRGISFAWGWSLFDTSSYGAYNEDSYNDNLARAAIYLCDGTYQGQTIAETRMKNLGFVNPTSKYYTSDNQTNTSPITVASALAVLGSEKHLIVAVAVRGTYLEDDLWDLITDIRSGLFNVDGFAEAGEAGMKVVKDYCSSMREKYAIDKNHTILFVTGHSLGAAIAGQIAGNLEGEVAIRENIFAYTFASPYYETHGKNVKDYTNIYNIINTEDAVPKFPLGGKRYGIDKNFKGTGSDLLDQHMLHTYFNGLIGDNNFSSSGDNYQKVESQSNQIKPGEYTSGDYTYKLSQSGDVEIIKYNGHDSIVTVPATLDGHPVTAIGDDAFSYHSGKYGINSITLPDSITSIGNHAFSDCYINSITLPSNLKKLGDGAFSSCWPLTSITLPDSITEIGANPFYDCLSLESIRVSSSHPTLATIDGVLFYKPEKRLVCYPVSKKNSSYTVPQGIRVIGDNAFCNNFLKSVTLPDSVTAIGKEAFSACENLITVTFSDSVTAIGDNAFPNSPYLTITVPNESYGELYCKENRLSYKTYGSEATPTEEPISFHFKDDARQWYEPMVTFPVGYIEIYTNGNINDVKIVGCELSDESNIILAYYEEPANVEGDHLYHQFGISSIPDYAGIHYTLLPGANYKFREYVIYNGKKYYNGWIYFKMRDWLINGQ